IEAGRSTVEPPLESRDRLAHADDDAGHEILVGRRHRVVLGPVAGYAVTNVRGIRRLEPRVIDRLREAAPGRRRVERWKARGVRQRREGAHPEYGFVFSRVVPGDTLGDEEAR